MTKRINFKEGEGGENWPPRESGNALPEPTFSVTSSGLDLILTIDQFGVSQTFYTTDGTTPTINSELYGPNSITVECCDSMTYKAFRSDWFFPSSNIATCDLNFLYILDVKFGSFGLKFATACCSARIRTLKKSKRNKILILEYLHNKY